MKCNICGQKIFHKRGIKLRLCTRCITGLEPVLYSKHLALPNGAHYKVNILFNYDKTAKELLKFFKFRRELCQAKSIVALILENLDLTEQPDIIVSTPSHFITEVKRGFSHTAYLANIISRFSGIKLDTVLSQKIFPLFKHSQKKLNRKNRIQQKNRFYLRKDSCVLNKKILLIDDVFTTGKTVEECTTVLLENGASSVNVVCFALTPM